jgi:hypothetical protein
MTPKEKAKEIFNRMYQVSDIMDNYPMCFDTAKQCALIAVDEIISSIDAEDHFILYNYWQKVKQEIENLLPKVLWRNW